MSDISYTIITATAGATGAILEFVSSVPDFVLNNGRALDIALKSNKFNVDYSIELVSGDFIGTYSIETFGYETSNDLTVIKTASFNADVEFTGTAVFKIAAAFLDQTAESNEFTVVGTGSPLTKELIINTEASTLTNFDNSDGQFEIVVERGALLFTQPQGQVEFTDPGATAWVVPDGVTQVSAVAIGGGGGAGIGGGAGGNLAYNTFSVTPGQELEIVVGSGGIGVGTQAAGESSIPFGTTITDGRDSYITTVSDGAKLFAPGGKAGNRLPQSPQTGNDPNWWKAENTNSTDGKPVGFVEAQAAGQTLHLGGSGGNYNPYGTFSTSAGQCEYASAGGGAAGYAGTGGEGAPFTNTFAGISGLAGNSPDVNSGGAGGGGTFRSSDLGAIFNGAGGGTGIYGIGLDGSGGSDAQNNRGGTGGSGGATGSETGVNSGDDGVGGLYGGGGGGTGTNLLVASSNNYNVNNGGDGAVRIIWGENRAYPSTNVQDVQEITQDEVDSTLGLVNDSPAFTYNLTDNPPITVNTLRTITAKQFKRTSSETSVFLPVKDDPVGTEGTNTGTFTFNILATTDGYSISQSSIDLTITENPNPPVREVFIANSSETIEVDEGNSFAVTFTRVNSKNGQLVNNDTLQVDWGITTASEKIENLTGTAIILAGQESVTINIPTVPDFSTIGIAESASIEILGATSSNNVGYVIVSSAQNIVINNVTRTVEIISPTLDEISVDEGSSISFEFEVVSAVNSVIGDPISADIFVNIINNDPRLEELDSNELIVEDGDIFILSTTSVPGIQSTSNIIIEFFSANNNVAFIGNRIKTITINDTANISREVYIYSDNIVATEGEDISVVLRRISTADGLDNYNDGGVTVPWRILSSDSRYLLTSGVAIFANGETEKTVTIGTTNDVLGSNNIVSQFEIYNATNNYSITENANIINLTLNDNDPFYKVDENKIFLNENETVTFNISSQRVTDGTTVYAYLNLDGPSLADFSGNVYKRNTVDYTGTSSSLTAEITTNPRNSAFDNAIASKGDLLVVGDCYASPAGVTAISGYTAGQVKVYRNISGTWTLEQTIVSPNSQSGYFGWDVGVDDDRIVIGEYAWGFVHPTNPSLNENANGAAYIYKYNSTTEIWSLEQSLPTGRTSSNPAPTIEGAAFGWSVAIENNFVVVGAPFDYTTYAGKIYVYKLDAGTWNFFDVEIGPYNNTFGDRIGYNIKLHNKIIVDGQVEAVGQYNSPGEARIYLIGETELSKFSQGFESNKFNSADRYGYDVAIYNNWSAVIWFDPVGDRGTNTSKLEIYNLADGAWTKTQVIDYSESIHHVEIFEDYMFVVGQTKDIFYENQSNSWVEIHSETTTQSGSLNRGRRQSQINNTTKQIMKLDGSNVKLYTPQFNSSPVTITNNAGSYSVTIAPDDVDESGEKFKLELWSDIAPNGTLLASSNQITIADSSYAILSPRTSYNEGQTINIEIQSDIVENNEEIPFSITGISESDVESISGPGFVSGSWAGNTYTGTLIFSRVTNAPLQQVYGGTNNQTWNFIVPDDIEFISAVAVGKGGGGSTANPDQLRGGGGGALAYSNNIPVTPGETLIAEMDNGDMFLKREDGTVILKAEGGGRGISNSGGQASNSIGNVKYSGGSGDSYQLVFYTNSRVNAGGGGAAGYTGSGNQSNGGRQGYTGVISNTEFRRIGGGGIGLKGTSTGTTSRLTGEGAYGGGDGGSWSRLAGGSYGGGGGAGTESNASTGVGRSGDSSSGGLRIIWGSGRSYPSNADDAFGPSEVVGTSELDIVLAEDLSALEGTENLIFSVNETSITNFEIIDTSFVKQYNLDQSTITVNETDSGVSINEFTINRTYTEGILEVPLTWSGNDPRFSGNADKTVTFADGESSVTTTVQHTNDTTFSDDATGTYTLGEVTGWTRSAPYVLTYNLKENESGTRTITMQIPAGTDYYTVANGENLLTTCMSMSTSSSSYRLYKINSSGSVTLLDSVTVSHPSSLTGTFRRGVFVNGGQYASYENVTGWSGNRSLIRPLADHVIANNYYGSIGLFYCIDSGSEFIAASAGVQIAGLGTSNPTLLSRSGRSFYIAAKSGRTYNRIVPTGFISGISGINESAGKMGAYWPNGGNGAMYFTSSTAFSVSSDGYRNNYYQDTPADRDGTDTGKNLSGRQSTSFIWSPDAAIEQ